MTKAQGYADEIVKAATEQGATPEMIAEYDLLPGDIDLIREGERESLSDSDVSPDQRPETPEEEAALMADWVGSEAERALLIEVERLVRESAVAP